jgi:hypothetical protein
MAWTTGELGFDSRKRQETFIFSKATKPVGNSGYSDRGVKLTSHHLVAKLRMGEAILPFPHASSWRDTELVKHRENFTFYLT